MTELTPLALAREFYSRATPYRLLQRVAGLAFNFSATSLDSGNGSNAERAAEDLPRTSGFRPALRAL